MDVQICLNMKEKRDDSMKYYAAPMEGITGYVYRNAQQYCFPGADQYYTPFLSPNQNRAIGGRGKSDVLPENNQNISVVPQILTNNATYFLAAAKALQDMGYTEVNLNLGCPSATVVTKCKGAGFLAEPERLSVFLEEIFAKCPLEISLKTRLGMQEAEEVFELNELFAKFPVKEWILHARVREDYYRNTPHIDIFEVVYQNCNIPLCYNGDVFSCEDAKNIANRFPKLHAIMIGRGLLTNPALIQELQGGDALSLAAFRAFHDRICAGYVQIMSGERNVLFKMKELWTYWGAHPLFADKEKQIKKMKKTNRLSDYTVAVNALF